MAELGWTFKVPDQHPWFVISDPRKHPQGHCLCINITDECNYHGDGFILKPGAHPWIYKPSVLFFPDALETRSTRIDSRLKRREIIRGKDADAKLLKRIINCAGRVDVFPQTLGTISISNFKFRHYPSFSTMDKTEGKVSSYSADRATPVTCPCGCPVRIKPGLPTQCATQKTAPAPNATTGRAAK